MQGVGARPGGSGVKWRLRAQSTQLFVLGQGTVPSRHATPPNAGSQVSRTPAGKTVPRASIRVQFGAEGLDPGREGLEFQVKCFLHNTLRGSTLPGNNFPVQDDWNRGRTRTPNYCMEGASANHGDPLSCLHITLLVFVSLCHNASPAGGGMGGRKLVGAGHCGGP